MLAYQMIYTACGKNKAGDFSVWAKSNSVTKQECDEIMKVMSYRKPKNVPYDPTEEEVETLFPKKISCFSLSSGRKCIAQSSYIGKVYSELDQRSGNFIIHAYIYEPDNNFNPFSIFNLPIFKTKLTVKEWRDDPVPADLPQVEISNAQPIQEGVLKNFLTGERKSVFKNMLQAVINICKGEEVLTFNDTAENERLFYAAISTFLPKFLRNKLTFTTCHAPQTEYSMASVGVEPIKIRNILDSTQNSAFNYTEHHSNGKYVFCPEKKLYADVQVGRYVEDVVESLFSAGLFDLLKKVDEIGAIAERTNCGLDVATDVYYVKNKQLNVFKDNESFNSALKIATDSGLVDAKTIAPYVYTTFIQSKRWGVGLQVLPLVKYVYENCGNDVKGKIVEDYLSNLSAYGVNEGATPKAYAEDVKTKAPFGWKDLVVNIVSSNKCADNLQKTTNKNEIYLIYDASTYVMENRMNEYVQMASTFVVTCLCKDVVKKDLGFVRLLLERSKNLGSTNEYTLINKVYGDILNQPTDSNINFFVEIINIVSDENKVKLFTTLVETNMQATGFIRTYVSIVERNPVLKSVEATLKGNPKFKDFYFKLEAVLFREERNIDFRRLDEYFRKFYLTGYDTGAFFEKLKENLNALRGKEKLSNCAKWFEAFSKLQPTFNDVNKIIVLLERETYSINLSVLAENSTYNTYYSALDKYMKDVGNNTSGGYEALATVLSIRGKYGEGAIKERIRRNSVYEYIKNERQLKEVVNSCAEDILELYLKERHTIDVITLFSAVFGRPFVSYAGFSGVFANMVDNCKQKDGYTLLLDSFVYAFNVNNVVTNELKPFIEKYVDDLSKGERKKLFKYIEEEVDEQYKQGVLDYIESINSKSSGGFFSKLFGKKNKGGDEVNQEDEREESPREARKRERQERKERTRGDEE